VLFSKRVCRFKGRKALFLNLYPFKEQNLIKIIKILGEEGASIRADEANFTFFKKMYV